MKVDLKLQYKQSTGLSATIEIASEYLTMSMDGYEFDGMSGSEIRHFLDDDSIHNAKWGIFIDKLPREFTPHDDVALPTPEYVKWLEEQVENKNI